MRGEPYRQSIAAVRLVQSRSPKAVELVHKALADTSRPDVQLALLAAVQSLGDVRYVDRLVTLLGSADDKVVSRTIAVLGSLPSRAVLPALSRVVSDAAAPAAVRARSVRAIGATLDPAAVKGLLPALKDASPQVVAAAADALEQITGNDFGSDAAKWGSWWQSQGDRSPEELLLAQLRRVARRLEEQGRLAGQAEQAVLKLHRRLLSVLSEGERRAHVIEMGKSEFASVRADAAELAAQQVKKAGNGTDDPSLRGALTALLLRGCGDSSARVRAESARGLGAARDVQALPKLLGLLDDPDPSVQSAAARSLGLLAFGSGPKSVELKRRAGAALMALLENRPPELIAAAAHSLGLLAANEAVPALARLLRASGPDQVRVEAAQALETVATLEAMDVLYQALRDKETGVRFSAVGALRKIAGDAKLTAPVRQRMAKELVGVLEKDADAGVRARAASVIGIVDGPDVLQPLWQCLNRQEVDQVKVKAWEAMLDVILSRGDLGLMLEWEAQLAKAGWHERRCQLLQRAVSQWAQQKDPPRPASETRRLAEHLALAYLDAGAWQSALPLARELLGKDNPGHRKATYLGWILRACETAIASGRPDDVLEPLRAAQSRVPEGQKALAEQCASLLARAETAAKQKSQQRLRNLGLAFGHVLGTDAAQKEAAQNLIKVNWRTARELILDQLASTDVAVRTRAKAVLEAYLNAKIAFDPKAAAATRARQLAALKTSLQK